MHAILHYIILHILDIVLRNCAYVERLSSYFQTWVEVDSRFLPVTTLITSNPQDLLMDGCILVEVHSKNFVVHSIHVIPELYALAVGWKVPRLVNERHTRELHIHTIRIQVVC